jgi:hypothetical protein
VPHVAVANCATARRDSQPTLAAGLHCAQLLLPVLLGHAWWGCIWWALLDADHTERRGTRIAIFYVAQSDVLLAADERILALLRRLGTFPNTTVGYLQFECSPSPVWKTAFGPGFLLCSTITSPLYLPATEPCWLLLSESILKRNVKDNMDRIGTAGALRQ